MTEKKSTWVIRDFPDELRRMIVGNAKIKGQKTADYLAEVLSHHLKEYPLGQFLEATQEEPTSWAPEEIEKLKKEITHSLLKEIKDEIVDSVLEEHKKKVG